MTRHRGQTEMVGVVMIAVILIIGVLLYARVGMRDDGGKVARDASLQHEAKSFLIAFLATDLPRCGTSIEGVARACIERDAICPSGDPCRELQRAMDTVAEQTLARNGMRYNLTLEGTTATSVLECESADRSTLTLADQPQPIIGSRGAPLGKSMRLAVCR